jgi:putative (di)nucleoside polyphosphate hydrolase
MALTELARFLPRGSHHNRYLRSGMRPHHRDDDHDGRPVRHDARPAEPAPLPPDKSDLPRAS